MPAERKSSQERGSAARRESNHVGMFVNGRSPAPRTFSRRAVVVN